MNSVLITIILVPIVEIYLFIKIGAEIGALNTIFLIFITAIIGIIYARYEGLNTLRSGFSQLIKNEEIKLIDQTHKIYKGLKKTASGLRRIVSVIKPEAPKQARQTVRLMDDSIVRVQYTVEGELADVLFGEARKKTIGSVDYSPPAHASCQY